MATPASNIQRTGISFDEVIRLPRRGLEQLLRQGATPSAAQLADWEFKGYNTPFYTRLLGFQKFVKGFRHDEQGRLYGYNLVVEKATAGPDASWVPKKGGGPEARHGFYDVVPVTPGTRWGKYPNAVLLDYGSGRNAWFNPEGLIRDYLVQVDPANPDLFLGKAYLNLGIAAVFVSFFVLDRLQRVPEVR